MPPVIKNYIVFAIPVFFLLIGVELLIMKFSKSKLYRFNDSVTNISCGVVQQVFGAFIKTILILAYKFLYDNHALFDDLIGYGPFAWIILFIGVDFFYYWFHRYAHEISVMWGTHVVHHQSEEYNLSVALRQSAFQSFFSTVFYLPLAVLGFHPAMFIIVNQFQTLYQFWIHTRTIKKMPRWFEFIFNTPSHHRVHHGINPKYIDKNHGGTLIIFDRLFGTFQEEEEEVVYGVTKPLATWNPIWANFDYYKDLWQNWKRTSRPGDKMRLLFKPPGWLPEELGGEIRPGEVEAKSFRKFDTKVSKSLNYYVLFQYVVTLGLTTFFLFFESKLPDVIRYSFGIGIFLSVMNLGGIFELKRWALPLEYARLVILCALLPLSFAGESAFLFVSALAFFNLLLSGYWLSENHDQWKQIPGDSPPAAQV